MKQAFDNEVGWFKSKLNEFLNNHFKLIKTNNYSKQQ